MNPLQMRWKSGALGHTTDLHILAPEPERIPPPWPVLYLLHGRSDDASAWTRFTTIERQADGFPFLIVMPNAYITYYRDPIDRRGMESAIIEELIPMIDATFATDSRREARFISGLSMGGYGALYLGVKYPQLFSAISAHSPATIESKRGDDVDRAHHLSEIWGNPVDESRTLFHLLAHADRATMPRIRVDIGDRDFLLDEARMLRAHLIDCGIEHSYVERPGAHDWNYWERQIGETLRFMMTAYGSAQSRDANK